MRGELGKMRKERQLDHFKKNVFFLWLHLQHMEVPGLGIEWELQLQVYNIATATPDPNHICNLMP